MPSFAPSLDGARIAYETHGTGDPALVLVHGWSCDRSYWDAQIPRFAADTAVLTLDLAGHGDSDLRREDWTMQAFGADVVAVIEMAVLDDVILVGHSMGVDVILEAARDLRGCVRGLVWVDQYSQLSEFMSEARVQERLAPFRANFPETTRTFVRSMFAASSDPALIERICQDMSSAPPPVALAALEATWSHAHVVPALLSEINIPVIAINARAPSTDPESMNTHGVEVIVMPGVGHFPMLERPEEFNACLAQAIQRINVGPQCRLTPLYGLPRKRK